MRTQHSVAMTLAPIVLLAPLTGCGASSVAKQAFHEIRGATAKIILTHELADDALLDYRGVRFDHVTTTVGDKICPPKLRRYYDQYTAELSLDLREAYPGGDPSLRVSSEILYFQRKGLLSGAECLTRVKMHDTSDQRLVVDAIVRAESKAFRAGGENALAESNVKAVGKFLKKRRLEEDNDEDDENEKDND